MPPPFAQHSSLGTLSESEAIALLKQVLEQQQQPLPYDVGVKQQWLKDFVKAMNGHARALVLVALLAAQKGFKAGAEDLAAILAELHHNHPDSRELSLYASLELSLRRLSAEHRGWVKALAVFQGGFHTEVLRLVLELDDDKAEQLAMSLVQVGLAEYQNHAYFSLDPALSPYLNIQLSASEYTDFKQRWFAAMQALVDFLYQQRIQDAQLAAQLTLLELPNLLALLTALPQLSDAEQTAVIAGCIEQLFADLRQPQALALAVNVRREAATNISVWGPIQFENKRLDIERFLQQSDFLTAHQQAEFLLEHALQAGSTAYQGADYDIALAYLLLGTALNRGGYAEAALDWLKHAQQSIQALVSYGNKSTIRLESATLDEQGTCLRKIGRLEAASDIYQQAINLSEKVDDIRSIAITKDHLATVRLNQSKFKDALAICEEVRDIFSQLREPKALAGSWHLTGSVYREMEKFELAEKAFQNALNINSMDNAVGEADCLSGLGLLYTLWGKLERAAVFYRHAADIYTQLGDKRYEATARNNLANSLIQLQRYEEARNECQRAIECKKAFGHSAEPWKTWSILHNLEKACNDSTAAHAAKQQAIHCYCAYRRDGGENMNENRQLYEAVLQATRENNCEKLQKDLSEIEGLGDMRNMPGYLNHVIPKLIAILQGERNSALADDPELDYDDAAELLLLLEAL